MNFPIITTYMNITTLVKTLAFAPSDKISLMTDKASLEDLVEALGGLGISRCHHFLLCHHQCNDQVSKQFNLLWCHLVLACHGCLSRAVSVLLGWNSSGFTPSSTLLFNSGLSSPNPLNTSRYSQSKSHMDSLYSEDFSVSSIALVVRLCLQWD